MRLLTENLNPSEEGDAELAQPSSARPSPWRTTSPPAPRPYSCARCLRLPALRPAHAYLMRSLVPL